jgi:hypothetical protein
VCFQVPSVETAELHGDQVHDSHTSKRHESQGKTAVPGRLPPQRPGLRRMGTRLLCHSCILLQATGSSGHCSSHYHESAHKPRDTGSDRFDCVKIRLNPNGEVFLVLRAALVLLHDRNKTAKWANLTID